MVTKLHLDGETRRRLSVRGRDVPFWTPDNSLSLDPTQGLGLGVSPPAGVSLAGEPVWPTAATTGIAGVGLTPGDLTPSGSITTTSNGQVISELDITGKLTINHNNVTVQRCRVRYVGTDGYAVHIHDGGFGTPQGVVLNDVEIDNALTTELSSKRGPAALYLLRSQAEINRMHIHNAFMGIIWQGSNGQSYIRDSLIENDRPDYNYAAAHREPMVLYGSHLELTGSYLRAKNINGVSAALAGYNDTTPCEDFHDNVIRNNLFVAADDDGSPNAGYAAYYGYSKTDTGCETFNVTVDGNWHHIGRSGYSTAYQPTQPGNTFVNNRKYTLDGSPPHGEAL